MAPLVKSVQGEVRIPALRPADAHAEASAATYMYEFAWAVPGLGAVHTLEVPQVLADTMHNPWDLWQGIR